eukprot:Gb_36299 [translate_table: standard]
MLSSAICRRRALTRACTRTSACMQRMVMLACFLTLCPLTNACSLTSPFRARKALLARYPRNVACMIIAARSSLVFRPSPVRRTTSAAA